MNLFDLLSPKMFRPLAGRNQRIYADLLMLIWERCGTSASEKEYCGFYNRPYGASLCHAWASGPVFLLPRILLGLRPLEDGWKTFTCRPSPDAGNLRGAVPTPHGLIEAEWVNGTLSLRYPQGIRFSSRGDRQNSGPL